MEINVLRDCGWFNLTFFFIFFILPEVDFSLIIFEYIKKVWSYVYISIPLAVVAVYEMWVDSYMGDNEVNIMFSSIFLPCYNGVVGSSTTLFIRKWIHNRVYIVCIEILY